MSDNILFRYQPDAMSIDILKKLFVGENRKKILSKLTKDIKKAIKNKSPKHYLIVGSRGIGKTHFLTLLCNELNDTNIDSFTIKLSEEEFSIYRVSDFLMRILENIDPNYNRSQLFKMNDNDVTELLIDKLKHHDKNFIICMENVNQILGEQMNELQVKKLRSLIQEENNFFILGSAPLIFPEITKSQEPFFNFFEIIYLNELTREELKTLIKNIAEIEHNHEYLIQFEKDQHKIDAVVTLTGGNPRIAILLYNLMTNRKILDVEKAFFKILDESTPYYQDIFRMLSGEKRKIFDTLISLGKPSTPKEIAEYARLDPSSVYTQIRRLENEGYVKSYKIGRKSIYEVRERLFRLWRELRREAFAKKRMSILINFLEVWYSPDERRDIILDCLKEDFKSIDNGYKEISYWYVSLPNDYKEEILSSLINSVKDENFIKKIVNSSLKDTTFINNIFTKMMNAYDEKKYEKSLEGINKLLLFNQNEILYSFQGLHHYLLNDYEEANKSYDKAIKLNPKNFIPYKLKANIYRIQKKYLLAIDNYKISLELNKDDVELYNMISTVYYDIKNYNESLYYVNKYLEIFPNNFDVTYGKAMILCNLNKYDEAMKMLNEIKKQDKSNRIYSTMAILSVSQKKIEEAIGYINEGLTLNPNDVDLLNIRLVIYMRNFKGRKETLEFINNSINMDLNERNMLLLKSLRNIITHNINQGLKYINNYEKSYTEDSLTTLIYNSFILRESHYQFKEENYKNGRLLLNFSLKSQQNIKHDERKKTYDQIIIFYLKSVCKLKNIKLLEEIINNINNKKDNIKELIKPYSIALEIVKYNKDEKYYDVQIELRDAISQIVNMLKNGN